MLPPVTREPGDFSTGRLSPVSMDSSAVEMPSYTWPSTGKEEPGLTMIISPTATSSRGTSNSLPSFSMIAVVGLSCISFFIASEVFPLLLASRYLPTITRVITTDADSKYRDWV